MEIESEEKRLADRLQAVAFRKAREAGAEFIDRRRIANALGRSMRWVAKWYQKDAMDCFTDYATRGRPPTLSLESQQIVLRGAGQQRKSCRALSSEILAARDKRHSASAVYRFLKSQGFKSFHVIEKPLKTAQNVEDRLFLANSVSDFDDNDFIHFAFSDEFFIYAIRKPNHQNDRIWAIDLADIDDDEHFRNTVAYPTCIGLFLMFTAKRLLWVIKQQGQMWTGQYFRDVVLQQHVFPFLGNEDNVLVVGETTFVHDKAPCMRANATQHLIRQQGIQFWGNDMWPGNSPDLNPTENLGEIVKDRVEARMHREAGPNRYSVDTLMRNLTTVLNELEFDTHLFENLLCSMTPRIVAVIAANGGHTDC